MTLLLDTQVWLWMQVTPERLRADVRELIAAPTSTLYLSAASAWEIAIKYALGRLLLPAPPERYVPERMRSSDVVGLAIEHAHALRVAALEHHHRDPFDRLLVAQAQLGRLPLVTADAVFDRYDVDVIPAR